MLTVLNRQDSIANQYLLELRDKSIQANRARFRKNVERLGELMAYELSKQFQYNSKKVETPLGIAAVNTLAENPVLITVLRAGLPYFTGFQHVFEEADCGFIGAYRKEDADNLTVALEYFSDPDTGRTNGNPGGPHASNRPVCS